ncbi:MAG: amidohydrolase family protein [Gammaproteobacteria bacterium]|nr:amidohydrolase family protein [Gammaproteobacteria bacterium]
MTSKLDAIDRSEFLVFFEADVRAVGARTIIRKADWIVAYDEARDSHKYLLGGDIVFEGDTIIHVGGRFDGDVTRTVDGRGLLVMPGLIDVHAHAHRDIHAKGFFEDLATKHMWMTQLLEYTFVLKGDETSCKAALEASICSLLRSGCTTLTELFSFRHTPLDDWIGGLAATGIRAYVCPMVQSGHWYTTTGRDHLYKWYDGEGIDDLKGAIELIDAATEHPSGRLRGMVGAAQADTCTETLFVRCKEEADRRGIPLQTHAAQSVMEFREMIRRHGKTPIEWLQDIGVLGSNVLLGHAINIDQHPWVNHHAHGDMERLAGSGVTVVNCARAFAQWGDMLRSHGSYRAAGVNIALGTDGYPHDMIEEMRISGLVSKVASGHVDMLRTEHVFEAATLGGARALGRSDLGCLSVGAKADIVLVDLAHPSMRPVRDPLRSLVYSGVASAVRDVYVGGDLVVKGGEVLTIDEDAALEQLQAGQSRAMGRVKDLDWAGREADEISPLCLPVEGPADDNDRPDAPGKPTF